MALARGWRLLIAFLLLSLGLSVCAMAAEGPPQVLGARAASHDGITRFVLDVSRKVRFSPSVADNGDIVLDLPEMSWQAPLSSFSHPVGLIRTFHFSVETPGSSRLVLSPRGQAELVKAFLIPPGETGTYRIVIDLGPASSPPSTPVPAQKGARPPAAKPNAAAAAALDKTAVPRTPRVLPVVVIDPGHGGIDPGATSLTGAHEKNIVLALAHDVESALEKDGRVRCVLTRKNDVFIPLRDRVSLARASHADLFISLHADTVDSPSIRGLSVYTLSQTASDAEAQALADKENKADIVAGVDFSHEPPEVTNILIDLVQRESMNLSAAFAARVIREVKHDTHNVLEANTHRFAGFAVLKAPDVPSVLIETGYLSNSQDEQLLRRPDYRAKLASALARAIEGYFADTHKARRK